MDTIKTQKITIGKMFKNTKMDGIRNLFELKLTSTTPNVKPKKENCLQNCKKTKKTIRLHF
jgi:hypothetical protein